MPLDDSNSKTFPWAGSPTDVDVENMFPGETSPNMGEQYDTPLVIEGNRFPRETGTDSLTEEEAQLA